ncbi:RAS guanyl-releasing protein 1 [Orchesella cincta]|uniref:RAS guanyl-releasing protein 1 n=1 Tax=Orchesella cincta TaxID=48709 RepID=A0A1D2N5U6_ORCCI|nr:RAS guanyl-releasing protein 1 [Orchesella cincta]
MNISVPILRNRACHADLFRKMTQLFLIFKELQDLQQSMPPAEANTDLLNTLKLSLDFNYSEDEIYELSLAREPRASNSISPTRGPGQHDNANGSYEKQVQSMVDAVFRNYDSNRDGFISRDEFQALSNNFPAIDAFFVLDENRDGMISKLELERYLRNRKNAGASHNFHEQTYFKPTFCIHCSGLVNYLPYTHSPFHMESRGYYTHIPTFLLVKP